MNSLQTLRENLALTQVELSNILNIPVKTIRNWEQNLRAPSEYIVDLILDRVLRKQFEDNLTSDENYIPSFLTIKEKVNIAATNYNIEKIYLYGSYAKGEQTYLSDIDLYMVSEINDLEYFGVAEDFRSLLNKKVDLLSNKTIKKDSPIKQEIERTGILIYER